MNPTNNKNLPSRLRESSFRRYEQHIQTAVASFPNVIVISEKYGASLVTFASRLRDAMASLVMYHWESQIIDMDKFDEIYPKLKVSHVMPDRVVVGSAECIKEYYQQQNLPPDQFECLTNTSVVSQTTSKISASSPDSSIAVAVSLSQDTHDKGVELKLLAGLAALRALSQPIQIEIDNEQATWLEDNFDVVVTKVTDTTYNLQ